MTTFTRTTLIAAPVADVWSVLADLGNIAEWNPGVLESKYTSAETEGVGASRYCDLGNGQYLHEEAAAWTVNEELLIRIVDTNMPFEEGVIEFKLESGEGGTTVRCTPTYKLRMGTLGKILDVVMVRRMYARGMEALLRGLKKHVESKASALPI